MDANDWIAIIMSLETCIRPDPHTRRSEWNKSWEDDMARVYDAKILTGLRRTQHSSEEQMYLKGVSQSMLLKLEDRKKSLNILQGRITSRALEKLVYDNLEERWKSMTDEQREEIILEALYKTSCIPDEWGDARKWCPEMTISNLSVNHGKLFIDWLRLVISTRRVVGASVQPVLFPNPFVEKILDEWDMELFKRDNLQVRNYYISLVIWGILLAIYNDADLEHVICKPPKQVGAKEFIYETAEKLGGRHAARSVKSTLNKMMAESQAVNVCSFCRQRKSRNSTSEEALMKACAKCKDIGRIIRYCSRECQIFDWKQGDPRPHKQTCGRPLQPDDSLDPKPSSVENLPARIPEPAPTFERSFALEYQLNYIHVFKADYTFMTAGSDISGRLRGLQVKFRSDERRILFLIMRRRAFFNGDSDAVNVMFQLLCTLQVPEPDEELGEVSAHHWAAQLEREYGVKVDIEYDSQNVSLAEDEIEWAKKLVQLLESIGDGPAGIS